MRQKGTQIDPKAWRLTVQYRLRMGFMYEFENSEAKMSIHITQDGPLPACAWHIEGRSSTAAAVQESGRAPSEALAKVGHAWTANSHSRGLSPQDWVDITTALSAVGAI